MSLKLILKICGCVILFELASTRNVPAVRQYHNEKKLSTVEPFIPSKDWQVIKPGQSIPAGLHVRVNFQTGVREAKLLDDKTREKRKRKARKRAMRKRKRLRKKRKYHRARVPRRRSNGTIHVGNKTRVNNHHDLIVLKKKNKKKKKKKKKEKKKKLMNNHYDDYKDKIRKRQKQPVYKKPKGHDSKAQESKSHKRNKRRRKKNYADYAAANELQYYLTLCILISLLGGAFCYMFFKGRLTRTFSSACSSSKTV